MATYFQTYYPADSVAFTLGVASLASSSTYLAGRESTAVSNRSTLDLDHLISGKITVGTTPTVGTIRIYVVPGRKIVSGTVSWPDVFDGTDSAETVTSAGVRDACAILIKEIAVDASTSDRTYEFDGLSLASFFGGSMPTDYVLFVTHNTVAALNSSAGNHEFYYTRVQGQGV